MNAEKKKGQKKGALNEIRQDTHGPVNLYNAGGNKSGKLKMLVQSKNTLRICTERIARRERKIKDACAKQENTLRICTERIARRERERARWRHDICSCDKCSGPNFLEVVGLGLAL